MKPNSTIIEDRNKLEGNLEFRKELSALLKKYNAVLFCKVNDTIWLNSDGRVDQLSTNPASCSYDTVSPELEEKRKRKRREKNPLRRWIYEYNRYNPQLGTSVRKSEVYAKTEKEAERTAIRHCNDYTTYGSLSFKRLIQVSEPITVGVDVKERERHYDSLRKTYNEYEEIYGNHTEAFDKLTDLEAA